MPYFEIGGMIYETSYRGTTKGLDNLSRSRSNTVTTNRSSLIGKIVERGNASPEVQERSDGFGDFLKARGGAMSVVTGSKIARGALIAASLDGPLPVGDVIAAGILIGGGIYLIGDSMDWW